MNAPPDSDYRIATGGGRADGALLLAVADMPPGWTVLRDCALADDDHGAPAQVRYALLHPRIGVALLDILPGTTTPGAPDRLRRLLDAASFRSAFEDFPPIVYLCVPSRSLFGLGTVLANEFEALPPLALAGEGAWVGAVQELIASEPPLRVPGRTAADGQRLTTLVRSAGRPAPRARPGLRGLALFWSGVGLVFGGGVLVLQGLGPPEGPLAAARAGGVDLTGLPRREAARPPPPRAIFALWPAEPMPTARFDADRAAAAEAQATAILTRLAGLEEAGSASAMSESGSLHAVAFEAGLAATGAPVLDEAAQPEDSEGSREILPAAPPAGTEAGAPGAMPALSGDAPSADLMSDGAQGPPTAADGPLGPDVAAAVEEERAAANHAAEAGAPPALHAPMIAPVAQTADPDSGPVHAQGAPPSALAVEDPTRADPQSASARPEQAERVGDAATASREWPLRPSGSSEVNDGITAPDGSPSGAASVAPTPPPGQPDPAHAAVAPLDAASADAVGPAAAPASVPEAGETAPPPPRIAAGAAQEPESVEAAPPTSVAGPAPPRAAAESAAERSMDFSGNGPPPARSANSAQPAAAPARPAETAASGTVAAAGATQAAPKPQRPPTAATPAAVGALLARGDALIILGDVAAARLVYQRATALASGRAATAMGRTYDPRFLRAIGAIGVVADPEAAAAWYRKAAALGDADATPLLGGLDVRASR